MTKTENTKNFEARELHKETWVCEREETVINSPFMQVLRQHCRSSLDQREHQFYLLKSRDWCNIIPVTQDGKIVMIRQYRIGIADYTLEIPGGVMDSGENPEDSALRELKEETGYVLKSGGRVKNLGWTFPNPAILDNRCHSLIAGPVEKAHKQTLDDGEIIEVVEVPISEIAEKISNGTINHALILNPFLKLLLDEEKNLAELLGRFKDCDPAST